MVAAVEIPSIVNVAEKPIERRLTIQVAEIAADTTTIRSLDWDRDRFDIEFGLQNGTTYNSYIIRGEKLALVDTSHAKFRELYLKTLQGLIDPAQIDYLVISHTEPDHSGLVKEILALAPNVTVVATKVALQFLGELINQPFKQQAVKNGDQVDLGNGHILQFVNALISICQSDSYDISYNNFLLVMHIFAINIDNIRLQIILCIFIPYFNHFPLVFLLFMISNYLRLIFAPLYLK